MNNSTQQLQKIKTHPGFIAALDQSGGSTPKALLSYGIKQNAWSNEDEMFAIVHKMRTRIITSPSFTGERIIAAILFENTMDREIEGQPAADYLWNVKRVVPFLKVDKGLAAEKDGVHLMKAMPDLDTLLDRAKAKRIFGTKMRSVINQANATGVKDIVKQQFDLKVGGLFQNLFGGQSRREQVQHINHTYSHTPNARTSAALLGVDRNPLDQIRHNPLNPSLANRDRAPGH